MGICSYDDRIGFLHAHLVDGHIPRKSALVQTAERAVGNCRMKPGYTNLPRSWAHWDEDAVFENMAYNTRQTFCKNRPPEKSGYIWSEAWLLKPQKWAPEFTLKDEQQDNSRRRLLVTLYGGCDYGKQCLANLIKTSGIEIIPDDRYNDVQAFKEKAGRFLEDKVVLPFEAPCIIAGEKMQSLGYEYREFGN